MDDPETQAKFLEKFRADSIVEDCEAVNKRKALLRLIFNENVG